MKRTHLQHSRIDPDSLTARQPAKLAHGRDKSPEMIDEYITECSIMSLVMFFSVI